MNSVGSFSDRELRETAVYELPLAGSAPNTNIKHTIRLDDIRRGCFQQDCIPSVDEPEFVSASSLANILERDSLGIRLRYRDETRFYPFPMLETREIVNDTVAGDPLLVTYCPLCATGIVYERTVGDEVLEFGVSGMLWQSNLLMYDRAAAVSERNLWSQVLGEAVVGNRAGEKLVAVPSDIIPFGTWLDRNPDGRTLTTGEPRDPYRGEYYRVARGFSPDFNEELSPVSATTSVLGIIVNGQTKAYVKSEIPVGESLDEVAGERIMIIRSEDDSIRFFSIDEAASALRNAVPAVEGFWFSWSAAHPDTLLWQPTKL